MPVKIGFIGCGGIARTHFDALSKIDDARPLAFSDADLSRAEAAARRFEGNAYAKPAEMLERESLDAVYVCVPPFAHGEAERLVASAGCALFVEKPLATNMKTAEKIAESLDNARVLCAVGYHWRFYDSTLRLQKQMSGKGAFVPQMVYARWLGGFPGVPWWRKLDGSGGQLVEQATHVMDVARLAMGEVKRVSCVAALREMGAVYEGTTAPDVMALTMEFQSGAIGYAATTSMLGGLGDVGLSFYGREAIYELAFNTLTHKAPNETHTYAGRNDAYLDENRAFVEAVKTGRKSGIKSTYADALKTLRLTLAANQAAKSGKSVVV